MLRPFVASGARWNKPSLNDLQQPPRDADGCTVWCKKDGFAPDGAAIRALEHNQRGGGPGVHFTHSNKSSLLSAMRLKNVFECK